MKKIPKKVKLYRNYGVISTEEVVKNHKKLVTIGMDFYGQERYFIWGFMGIKELEPGKYHLYDISDKRLKYTFGEKIRHFNIPEDRVNLMVKTGYPYGPLECP